MRVLLLAFDSEELSIRLASSLAEHVEVCLMLPDTQSRPYLKFLDPKVKYIPFFRPRLRQPIRQLLMVAALLRRIKSVDPDLIHIQKWHLWFFLALPMVSRYPLVISIHDPKPHPGDAGQAKTPSFIVNFGYKRADRVIAHNPQMKDLIVRDLKIPSHLVDVVPLIERGDATLDRHITEPGNEVLFFGRLWAYKGLDQLIRAQPLITAGFPAAKIVIAGRGEDFSRYRDMMSDPGRFEVHNEYVSEEERAELFRRASVVVLPYVEASQSGVIPVAYTYAKPVVATRLGGLPSQVDDGETGILVDPEDPEALAEAVIYLLRNPHLRREMGLSGKRKLEKEWSAPVVARRTLATYLRLVESSDAGAGKRLNQDRAADTVTDPDRN